MTLEELKRTAPRGFDKTLIDLIAAIQDGQRPIVTDRAVDDMLTASVDALRVMASRMQEMEREAAELKQRLAQVEAPLRALAEEAKRRMEAA